MATYKLIAGRHYTRSHVEMKVGDVVESDIDLAASLPERFEVTTDPATVVDITRRRVYTPPGRLPVLPAVSSPPVYLGMDLRQPGMMVEFVFADRVTGEAWSGSSYRTEDLTSGTFEFCHIFDNAWVKMTMTNAEFGGFVFQESNRDMDFVSARIYPA